MRAFPCDMNIKKRGPCHRCPAANFKGAWFSAGRIVHAVNFVTREAIKQPIFNHRFGAAQTLFCGLENHDHLALKIARFGQMFRRTQQHGRMCIMTTGVHFAIRLRFIGQVRFLMNGQGVHIRTQPHAAVSCVLSPDHANNTRHTDFRMHLIHAKIVQVLGHNLTCAHLFKSDFRMLVKILLDHFHLIFEI